MKYNLNFCARDTVDWINKGINKSELVETILNSCSTLAKDPSLAKFNIGVRGLPKDTITKTHFEILCFASYWTSSLILKYVTTESFFKKKVVDVEAAQYFYKCIGPHLKESCNLNGLSKVFDLGVIAINPEIIVGPTILVDSDSRLNQYAQAALKGSNHPELNIYAKHLAITFGFEHSPIFEPLTYTFVEPSIKLATIAMKASFES